MSAPLHAGAMQLSGKYENVRNLWTTSGQDVSNGDTLGFTLVCINPAAPATLCMQLSGNAVTHKQMTFDFSLFNGVVPRQLGARIWMLAPAVQNRLKHAIGLADASVTSEGELPVMDAHAGVVDAYALGSNLKGEFFMQFGLVNQMSRGVAGSMRAIDYAKDATACTVPTNSEVLLRFTIGDPSVERECTGDEVVEFVRERTRKNIYEDDDDSYTELTKKEDELYRKSSKKHGHAHTPEYAKHLKASHLNFEHLKRSIGDRQFFKKYAEKYKHAAVIVSLIGAVHPKAKETVEKVKSLDAPPSPLTKSKEPVQPELPIVHVEPSGVTGVSINKQIHRRSKQTNSHPHPPTLGQESASSEIDGGKSKP